MRNPEKYWTDTATKALVGRKIVKVQYMTKDNAKESGWFQRPPFLILDESDEQSPACATLDSELEAGHPTAHRSSSL